MVNRSLWRAGVLVLGLWVATAVPARAGIVADPTGDVFNTGTIDITSTDVVVTPATTTIDITFAGAIAAPSAFAPNSVLGYIDLDTVNGSPGGTAPWGGPVTGGNSWINFFIPPNPGTPTIPGPLVDLGDEYYIDLGSELFHPGLVDIVDTNTNLSVGTAAITYGATSLSISFSTASIGSTGGLRYAVLVGDFLSPTDRAPNDSVGIATVPEPSTLVLASVAGLGALAFGRRRKQAS